MVPGGIIGRMTEALAGVRVLDLTRLLPGPACTRMLAEWGAEVLKIEPPEGDYGARLGLPADAPATAVAPLYTMVNRHKTVERLDLKSAAGRTRLLELVAVSDVLVEGFRPGVMARLGLDFDALREHRPALVYCAITGYGQDGPWALRAGHDLNYIAQSGVLEQTGTADGPPAIPALQIGDLLGGAMSAVAAMLAALHQARATGQGSFVDVAMAESVLAHNLFPLFSHAAGTTPARGADLLTGGHANYAVYRTSDNRYLAVAALEEKFWQLFCDAVGKTEWKSRYAETTDPALHDEVSALIGSRSLADWTSLLDAVDCCVTPVLTLEEALSHPQFRARGMALQADGMTQLAPPFRISGWDFTVERTAPAVGEHTDEVLAAIGYGADEIARLRQSRIV